jgi:hypothetical protein
MLTVRTPDRSTPRTHEATSAMSRLFIVLCESLQTISVAPPAMAPPGRLIR